MLLRSLCVAAGIRKISFPFSKTSKLPACGGEYVAWGGALGGVVFVDPEVELLEGLGDLVWLPAIQLDPVCLVPPASAAELRPASLDLAETAAGG